jgi:hypothetical protein
MKFGETLSYQQEQNQQKVESILWCVRHALRPFNVGDISITQIQTFNKPDRWEVVVLNHLTFNAEIYIDPRDPRVWTYWNIGEVIGEDIAKQFFKTRIEPESNIILGQE